LPDILISIAEPITATIGESMHTFETTDSKFARRCRLAQYRAENATLMVEGSPVTGIVSSVKEDASSSPVRWTITMVVQRRIAA
jgi:hypothetical protein